MHKNKKLFDLATKNSQQIEEEQFVTCLPDHLRANFESADRLYHSEAASLLAGVISKACQAHDKKMEHGNSSYVRKTSSRKKAWHAFISLTTALPSGEYWLVIGGGNTVNFDGSPFWVSELPAFSVLFPNALSWIKEFEEYEVEEILVTSNTGEKAVVIEAMSGFLPDEPSDMEVVYEITAWGYETDAPLNAGGFATDCLSPEVP